MGPYGCMERTWKPFNPLLGETFEVDLDNGVRFFAEQVSISLPCSRSFLCARSFLLRTPSHELLNHRTPHMIEALSQ